MAAPRGAGGRGEGCRSCCQPRRLFPRLLSEPAELLRAGAILLPPHPQQRAGGGRRIWVALGGGGGRRREGPCPSRRSLCPRPASLDAFVFSRLAPLLKAKLPNGKLQQHLKSLQNLCNYCTSILSLYFPWDGGETRPPASPRGLGVTRPPPPHPCSAPLPPQVRPRPARPGLQALTAARRRRTPTNGATSSCRCWWGWRPCWATPS